MNMNNPESVADDEVVDLEEYANAGKAIPKARHYRIRIDKTKYVVDVPSMTGRQLLLLAGKKPPERFRIDEKLKGGQTREIGLDEPVDFTKPGVERFMTLPRDQTDGEIRRQFSLPKEDVEHLQARLLLWETISTGGEQWLILHDFPVPSGFSSSLAQVGIFITPGYPTAPLDMAYFCPPLVRNDGKEIPGLAQQALDGKTWQRWSRHRSNENPWRPGEDSIVTHLALVEWWLERELKRN
jgi:hypothetical protein